MTDKSSSTNITLRLDRFLPYQISILNMKASQLLARLYQDTFGISVHEWQVLAAIGHQPHLSCQNVGKLTRQDKSAICRAVRSLVAAGLVTRTRNPADRRETLLSFTARGARVYRKIVPLAMNWQRQFTCSLDEDEMASLNRIINKLESRLCELESASV